ncbi:MAG: hypothetical protein KatS3mg129_0903 [Leptospiraceae bacterium]|nr:MAG: hypothetical protein KatS3mg129_0903 [Leptospiraceae bacterium]
MSSFFYTKNKYILSFNHYDLTEKDISNVIQECKANLNSDLKIHINLTEAKDIKIQNLFLLIDLILKAKKRNAIVKFSLSDELKQLFINSKLDKLFLN